MLDVYVGYDSSNEGQQLAHDICVKSLLENTNFPDKVRIHSLIKKDLEDQGIFCRPNDPNASTEFTYTRFLVPYLNNYEGYAVFCDSDFLWERDVYELLDYINNDLALSCVKHTYTECVSGNTKMDGLNQEWYPRKNWSSLMIFNCSHQNTKKLTPFIVNTRTPQWLHRMEWASDKIGNIPHYFNYLVGYYSDYIDIPRVYHYTDGGPWHNSTKNTQYASNWIAYLSKDQKQLYSNYMSHFN